MRFLAALLVLPLAAAITNVEVAGVTATQAVVRYTAPDTSACTHEVSDSATYTPLVNDVNTTLFSGANSDGGGSRSRTFVVGKRTVGIAADGLRYSRALETNRSHYGRITCGADQATYTFETNTVRLGNVYQEATPGDGAGGYEWPDINLNDPGKIIDPFTGVATYVVMEPRDFTATSAGNAVADCSGTGWTGTASCIADDAAYASTTGTNPLLAVTNVTYMGESHDGGCGRMSTFNDSLDYVQVELNGYGAGGTDAQRTVNLCLTRDNGQTCSANKQLVLPASDGTVTAGSSTTVDLWETTPWGWTQRGSGAGWVKTASATPTTTITFTAAADCARMRVGSTIYAFQDGASSSDTLTIQSLSCPTAVVDTAVNLYNGGLGVPFLTPVGIGSGDCNAVKPNKGFGVKISKANADSQAVYIDRVRFNFGFSPSYATGAGGFHNQCSIKDTANGGWYKCLDGSTGNPDSFMYAIRAGSDGEPEIRALGGTWVNDGICGWGLPGSFGYGARPWSGTLTNVLWRVCSDKVVKWTYSGNYVAKSKNTGVQDAAFTYADMMGGNSLATMIQAFATANGVNYDPYYASGWSMDGVQGPYITSFARFGNQDTVAYGVVFDLGNGLPIGAGWAGTGGGTDPLATDGTGFVKAMTSLFDRQSSSWCTLHTYEWVGNEPVACTEWQNVYWNRFGGGPYKTTLKTAISQCTKGTNCSNVTVHVDSAWDAATFHTGGGALSSTGTTVTCASGCKNYIHVGSQIRAQAQTRTVSSVNAAGTVVIDSAFSPNLSGAAWEYTFPTAPAWWHDGDPIGDYAPWALAELDVDDHLVTGNERFRVVSRTENAGDLTLELERGVWSSNGAVLGPHSTDAVLQTRCNSSYANYWYFTQDKTASGTTYYKPYDVLDIGHGTYGNGLRVQSNYSIQVDSITDTTRWNVQTHNLPRGAVFAGKTAPIAGNAYQSHPSNIQTETVWPVNRTFFDWNPFQGTNLFSVQNNTATSRVSGTTHVYKYTYGQGRAFYRKHLATFGVAGGRALKDISGPGSTITDSDRYKMCVADVAGECVTGSAAGDIYLNIPNLNQSYRYCAAGETAALGGDWDDACAGERSLMGHNNIQAGVFDPTVAGKIWQDTTAKYSRALTTIFDPYRYSFVGSFQPLPDASFAMWQGFDRNLSHWLWMLAKIPPMPPPDSIARSTFVPIAVQLKPPSGLGVNNAIVEFGYNASFHCTQRPEKCMANSATISEATPFVWPSEYGGDTSVSGLACASGCTITIPALSQKVLYYRWKYRNTSNAVLGEASVQVVAVP